MVKIIALNGRELPTPGVANEELVEKIEHLLEAARSGDITGIAYTTAHIDGSHSGGHVGEINGHGLLGVLEKVKHNILTEIM